MAISDKQFDAQFDKVANLVHYPWIGSGYALAPKRVLFMGHSHYAKDGKEFSQEEYDRNISDKEYTRGIISCAIEKGGWNFHKYLQKTFLYEDMKAHDFWSKIASYNFIQEPMKEVVANASQSCNEIAWKCFADVVQIIKPDICIFVGLKYDKGMNALDGENIRHFIKNFDIIINHSKPKFGELQFKDGYKLPFYMIHHTSMLYSPQLWHDFLNKEIPEVVSFLDK